MKIFLLLLIFNMLIILSICERQIIQTYKRQNYPVKFLKKSLYPQVSGRRALVFQIRSDSKVPAIFLRSTTSQKTLNNLNGFQIQKLPFKIAPYLPLRQRKYPNTLGKIMTNKSKIKKQPNFKKPLTSIPEIKNTPGNYFLELPNNDLNPIHTIPAPNLAGQEHTYYDNHIQNKEYNQEDHYSVVEDQTNDKTIQDPISNKKKLYAPDPDPSLPTTKIEPPNDPFSMPSDGNLLPLDVQANTVPKLTQAEKIINFVNSYPQHHLSNQYSISIDNQPQLQQYHLQQPQILHGTPYSVYNPTYLVTQSNNLLNQHQQKLFKPEINYFNPTDITNVGNSQTNQVASNGQIFEATKDLKNKIYTESPPPIYAALVSNQQQNPVFKDIEQNSFESFNQRPEDGFSLSNYYNNDQNIYPPYKDYSQLIRRQQENERILQQSNFDLSNNFDIHDDHQRLLAQHLSPEPLKIIVPDNYKAQNFTPYLHKRSNSEVKEKNFEYEEDDVSSFVEPIERSDQVASV